MSVTDGHQSYQPSATLPLTDFALGRALLKRAILAVGREDSQGVISVFNVTN